MYVSEKEIDVRVYGVGAQAGKTEHTIVHHVHSIDSWMYILRQNR